MRENARNAGMKAEPETEGKDRPGNPFHEGKGRKY